MQQRYIKHLPGLEKLDFLVDKSLCSLKNFRRTLCASNFMLLAQLGGTRVELVVHQAVYIDIFWVSSLVTLRVKITKHASAGPY